MKRILLLFLMMVLILSFTVLAADKPVLKVGSDVTYPPFEYVDEDSGEFVGFDIDLVKALGEEMGYEVEIINTAWDGIIPGLLNGNYDILISAMTITDERAQAVNFSDPYFTAGQVLVVSRDNNDIKVPADLKGKVVTVQIGTTGQFASEKVEGIKEIKKFNTTPEALQELRNGGAAAAVIDLGVAQLYVDEHPDAKIAGVPFTVEYYGIAIDKKNEKLLKDVNKALAMLKAKDTYDEIYNKWFSSGE
jgi:polar amino acid transport system substrate-binding protein